MKASKLVKGVRYWCGWASRYATFERKELRTWSGRKTVYYVFIDTIGAYIECTEHDVEKWVKEID